MALHNTSLLRHALLSTVFCAAAGSVSAQTAALPSQQPAAQSASGNAAPAETAQGEGKRNQRIERIHVEDSGARVDEVRYGGQTQSITVQPKTGTPMPAYEVRANDGARTRPGNFNESDSVNAPRVWNLRKF